MNEQELKNAAGRIELMREWIDGKDVERPKLDLLLGDMDEAVRLLRKEADRRRLRLADPVE